MKRLVPTLLATAALLVFSAGPLSAAAGDETVTVAVMKHACNPDVQNLDAFNAIIEGADGPVAALAATVLACPTIVNPGDDTTNGVKSDPAEFEFSVEDANGVQQLPDNTMAAKLCESDLKLDADGDGKIETTVCLDISHYVFEGLANGTVTVTEDQPPAGSSFGELLFTPTELDGNNDADSLVNIDRDAGVIELDTTADEDGVVMLHVYNFQGQLPPSSTAAPTTTQAVDAGLLIGLALAAGVGIWMAIGLRRRPQVTD